jgi:hypothetical protein
VRLHGGSIDVTSRDGDGSTFRVNVPLGTGHLPREQLVTSGATQRRASIALGAAAWIEEALRWLPSVASEPAAVEEMTVPSSKLDFLPGNALRR